MDNETDTIQQLQAELQASFAENSRLLASITSLQAQVDALQVVLQSRIARTTHVMELGSIVRVVPANVTGIIREALLTPGGTRYHVEWWNGASRHSAMLHADEVEPHEGLSRETICGPKRVPTEG